MKFSTTTKHESTACPGVSFWIRRLTEGRRIDLSMKLADVGARLDALRDEVRPLQLRVADRLAAAKDNEAAMAALNEDPEIIAAVRAQQRIELVQRNEMDPVYVGVLLAKVDGLEIDDQPATVAMVREFPRELYDEIAAAARKELGLDDLEKKSSQSSGTSAQAADGKTSGTTAETASTPESTATAAA